MVAPAENALLHAFGVEHAFGKALAHELFGNKLVVAVKVGYLAGIDELDGIEVLLGLGGDLLRRGGLCGRLGTGRRRRGDVRLSPLF